MRSGAAHGRRRPDAGFSTVDLLISAAIGATLLTGAMRLSTFQLTSMQDQSKQVDLQGGARGVMALFQREVRRTGLDPQCTGSFAPIAGASTWHLILQSDLDGSGAIDGDGEYVGYFYIDDLNTIYRHAGDTLQPLLAGVGIEGTRLRYFDAAGAEIDASGSLNSAQLAAVQRIRLELGLVDESSNGSHDQKLRVQLASDVTLRNRFFMSSSDCATPADEVALSSGAAGSGDDDD